MSGRIPVFLFTILSTVAVGAEARQATLVSSSTASSHAAYAVTAGFSAAQDDVAAKVKAALKADAELGSQSDAVTVTGTGGVVTIEGTVPSVQVRAKIAEFTMKVDGVTKLVNKLKLAKK